MCKRSSTLPNQLINRRTKRRPFFRIYGDLAISVIVLFNDNELSTRLISDGDRRSILAERVVTLRGNDKLRCAGHVFSLLRLIVVFCSFIYIKLL